MNFWDKCRKFTFRKTFIIFIFLLITKPGDGSQCNKEALICIDSQTFQECANLNGQYVLAGSPTSCPTSQNCVDSTGSAQCIQLSVVEPSCTAAGKHPAPACYQYWECISVMWWYQSQLGTCPDNQCFDVGLQDCAPATNVDCQSRTPLPGFIPTTTSSTTSTTSSTSSTTSSTASATSSARTTASSTTSSSASSVSSSSSSTSSITSTTTTAPTSGTDVVPSCSGPGKVPAPSCYQYYECNSVWWWYEPELEDCTVGYAFDIVEITCKPISLVDCQSRITTTVKTTTSTTTPVPLVTSTSQVVPKCSGSGRFPAQSCYQFYECEQVSLGWEPKLKSCTVGYAFDVVQITCRPARYVECHSRVTTTVKPLPVPPHTIVPKCFGPGRHPAINCYQYYQCVEIRDRWEAKLVTCFKGQAFDLEWRQCRPWNIVDCHHRQTKPPPEPPVIIQVPKCSGSSKHPAPKCHEYYECVSVWWWWEPQVKTCPEDENFDIDKKTCNRFIFVDCQSRQVPPVRPALPGLPVPPHLAPKCFGPGRHPAYNCHQYIQCVQVEHRWESRLLTCPTGYSFDLRYGQCQPSRVVDCHHRQTTPPNSVIPVPPVNTQVPKCSGTSKHPAPKCNQYYECVSKWWWWESQLKTCQDGDAFDIYRKTCIHAVLVDCQSRTTALVPQVPPHIPPPKCFGPSRHPSVNCYQYYQCVQIHNWWEAKLVTCPNGHAYDLKHGQCQPSDFVDCYRRQTYPKPTVPKVPEVPKCSSASKHPAPKCNQYYECVSVWWWWEPQLKTCQESEAFDEYSKTCRHWALVNCKVSGVPPHLPPGIPAIRPPGVPGGTPPKPPGVPPVVPPIGSPVAPPPPRIPVCTSPSKHPAPNCYYYYDCIQVKWGWEPYLKPCPEDQAFDIFHRKCVSFAHVDCQHRITVPPSKEPYPIKEPKCSSKGKHQGPSCYQYYECEQVYWWWEAKVKTCPNGEAFDNNRRTCSRSGLVNCGLAEVPGQLPPPPKVPQCSSTGNHPGPSCYQYYECEQVWWWWEAKLKLCRKGEAFDVYSRTCSRSALANCGSAVVPGARPPGVPPGAPPAKPPARPPGSHPGLPPGIPPHNGISTCSGPGKYPSSNCYQYYECVQNKWWWELELRTCREGQAFDTHNKKCSRSALVNCNSAVAPPAISPGVPPIGPPGWPPAKPPGWSPEAPQPRPPGWPAGVPPIRPPGWSPEGPQRPPGWSPGAPPAISPGVPPGWPPAKPPGWSPEVPQPRPPGWPAGVPPIRPPGWSPEGPQKPPGWSPAIPSGVPTCSGPSKHPAPIPYQYYDCISIQWWWEARLKTCPKGQAFDVHHRTCIRLPPTVLPPIRVPTCSNPGAHPSNKCYQYYDCVSVKWWLESRLKTCPKGQSFDVFYRKCLPSSFVDCQYRPERLPTGVPKCDKPGKHLASRCYQYYECKNVFWWVESELKTCPDGEGYYHQQQKCVNAELIGCKVPVKVPSCKEYGKYPASKCYQYYECKQDLWWWTPQLKSCKRGEGFSSSLMRCIRSPVCRHSGKGSSKNSSEDDSHDHSKESSSKENDSNSKESSSGDSGSKENSSKDD